MYKSIMVGNHERTKEVIHSAMLKHGLGGSPENYSLSQLLPDKGKLCKSCFYITILKVAGFKSRVCSIIYFMAEVNNQLMLKKCVFLVLTTYYWSPEFHLKRFCL